MKRHDADNPVCPVCSKVVELGMPIASHRSDLLHRWCYEALTAATKPAQDESR